MRFTFRPADTLPPLAWLAAVDEAAGVCHVEHGRRVETGDGFFIEGVWAGPFAAGGFDRCESVFGSGTVLRADGSIVFVPSSTTVDYLYYREEAGTFRISNSLPFLLAATDDRLVPFNPAYARVNDSIMDGIVRHERDIPTERGAVRRLMHENLVVRDGTASAEAKPLPPRFPDYAAYRAYLSGTLGAAIGNARDTARRTPLRIISTQSTGYDSTAINAVARDFGLDTVLSIEETKEKNDYFKRRRQNSRRNTDSDYGDVVAGHLGFEVTPIDRRYFERHPATEYLNWATIHNNTDMNLSQIERFVGDGAVLLTGVLGELWYNGASTDAFRRRKVNDELERWDLSGHGVSELRLHIGFVHLPAPYIGARSRPDLFRIADSDEMRAWSVGGTYDRPVARRIGEEAGVPREAFGQKKRATVVEVLPPYLPHGEPLRQEFFDFLRRQVGTARYLYIRLAPWLNARGVAWYRSGLRRWLRRITQPFPALQKRLEVPRFGDQYTAVLYAYCVNKTAEKYRENAPR